MTYDPDFHFFRLIELLDITGNFQWVFFKHCSCEMFCNYVSSLQRFFFMDVKYDAFLSLENHVCEEPEKEDYADKKYPERFFAEAFFNATVPFKV